MSYGPDDLPWNRFKTQQNKLLNEQVRDAPSDSIKGGRGGDFLEGQDGQDDFLIGLGGGDTFVLRAGSGDDTVVDFKPWEGDKIMFDFGTYSDYMVFGRLSDGQTWNNFLNTATFSVTGADVNNDGVQDTVISVTHAAGTDSVTVLGWAPEDLWGQWLIGG